MAVCGRDCSCTSHVNYIGVQVQSVGPGSRQPKLSAWDTADLKGADESGLPDCGKWDCPPGRAKVLLQLDLAFAHKSPLWDEGMLHFVSGLIPSCCLLEN